MINILLTGVGGQGTVLAAKVLAQAAHEKGWQVRTAETIGMAQRGGSVVSHVRIADKNGHTIDPLIPHGCADLIIGFEPGESVRVLPYLAREGTIVTACETVQPIMASLQKEIYSSEGLVSYLSNSLTDSQRKRFLAVETKPYCEQLKTSKVLNTLLLASAIGFVDVGISLEDLRHAYKACVKPSLLSVNLQAIELVANERV